MSKGRLKPSRESVDGLGVSRSPIPSLPLPRILAAAAAVSLLATGTAAAADPVRDQRVKVRAAQERVAALEARVGRLLSDWRSLEDATSEASAALGVAHVRVRALEQRAEGARRAFNARARDAYKRGALRQMHMLVGVRSFTEVVSVGRFLGGQIERDRQAFDSLIEARDALAAERAGVEERKQALLGTRDRVGDLQSEIQAVLISAQATLAADRGELARMEARRRAEDARAVSAAVEARRAARQADLDRKLEALLAWYRPGRGGEPFTPPHLRATGIAAGGQASWYGPGFHGRRASSGATFRQEQLTAASLVLPFGTLLKVTLAGRSVVVVITDRGPYVPGRVLDLSAGAAEAIGLTGVKSVRMEILLPAEPAPPFP